jgi:uncharacterized membrane protein YhhN
VATVIGATVACAGACALLVLAEWRGVHRLRVAAKLAASTAFVVAGVQAAGGSWFARFMLLGLVLGAIGDWALLGGSWRRFKAGIFAFLLGHVAYVVGIAQLEPPGRWLGDAGLIAALPLGVGLGALAILWPRLGPLRRAVTAYIAVIAVMVIAAIAAARAGALPAPQRYWLAGGAVLFFLSDLAVARDRFLWRGLANKVLGLPAYYTAQLLIAWSLTSSSARGDDAGPCCDRAPACEPRPSSPSSGDP